MFTPASEFFREVTGSCVWLLLWMKRANYSTRDVKLATTFQLNNGSNNEMKQAYFRPAIGDYVIKSSDDGAICIKPQSDGLVITANSNAAPMIEALLGEPTGLNSPIAQRHPAWRIEK